jgi:hypothetical protein
MHNHFTRAFLGAAGNGYSRMLAPPMRVTDSMWLTPDAGGYKLGSLELIGIAKHDTPVAFTDVFHEIAESRRETRALTAFEQKAIATLRTGGGSVVVEEKGNRRVVVGALRATAACKYCHPNYQEGDLLGALTYRLDRAKLPAGN